MCSLVAPAECSDALSSTDGHFHDRRTSHWTALLQGLSKFHSTDLCDNMKDSIRAQCTATVPQENPREKRSWAVCANDPIWFWCLSSEAVGVAKGKNNTCIQVWVRTTGTLFFNTLYFWQHSFVSLILLSFVSFHWEQQNITPNHFFSCASLW